MKTSYLDFSVPILVIDDFLSEEDAESILDEAIDLERFYQDAKVMNSDEHKKEGGPEYIVNTAFRKNDVIYVDDLFMGTREKSKILQLGVQEAFWKNEERRKIWREKNLIFDVINLSTRSETILSRYGNCDFYGWHKDPSSNPAHRLVTAVYYMNKRPEQFTGGEITFRDGKNEITVVPKHNRLVVFQSNTLHKVNNVRLDGDAFENGRFSLNIWFGFCQ